MMRDDSSDPESNQIRRDLQNRSEELRLQEEEHRVVGTRNRLIVTRLINGIYFLVGMLEVLLVLRFVLRLFGANTGNLFASVIYNLSEPFIAPFSTLFVSPVTAAGRSIFDVNILIAIIVYALLGLLAVATVRFIYRNR